MEYYRLIVEKLRFLKNLHLWSSTFNVNYESCLRFWETYKKTLAVAAAGGVAVFFIYRAVDRRWTRRHLQLLIDEKRSECQANIEKLRRKLQASAGADVLLRRKQIISLKFDDLRRRLQANVVTAVEVLEAYQWRALEAHAQTNCVCEFLPEAAFWAAALDEKYADETLKKPPLFGIPISVQESYKILGHDSTIGFVHFIGKPCDEETVMITTLKLLGAVPFVTTNVPQGLFSFGCSNPIYGTTTSPYEPARSCGGSSGGEGALIAMRGSPLGLGTDLGGGVRVPAHWCGICSLKPTIGRLSQRGRRAAIKGHSIIRASASPIGPNVDSLLCFMRAICSMDSAHYTSDPYVVPAPFNELMFNDEQPLTVGYYSTDNYLTPLPACRRAVDVAKRALESRGHRLIAVTFPFDFREMRELMACYAAATVPDGGTGYAQICEKDLPEPTHNSLLEFFAKPVRSRPKLVKRIPSQRTQAIYKAFPRDINQQSEIIAKIENYRCRFMDFWKRSNLDCVVCPALASTPLPNDVPPRMFFVLCSYCALFDLLDFPAGVVRCTNVTSDDEKATAVAFDEFENDWIWAEMKRCADGTVGLPVGVQCVALPYREEICLRMMKDIENVVRH